MSEPLRVPGAAPIIGEAELHAVRQVLLSGRLAQGAEVAGFEAEFAELVDGRRCVAVNSGTSALLLALLALGIGPGDDVVVPSFTFAATANAVALTGATPVFADIDPATYCLEVRAVEAVLTPRTAAIVPVHLYGHPADMVALGQLAARFGLALVEDAAQAHAATLHGRPAGALGDVAAFSFYPTKNMTCGEGGMVVCADESTARRVRLLRNQGMERRYANEVVGYNMRMTEVAAAMGRVQLTRLAAWTERRRSNAAHYDAHLHGCTTPHVADGAGHVFHQYTIRVDNRDHVEERLLARGIGVGVYYPTPVHRLPPYGLSLELPETERASREVLSIPVHPGVDDSARALVTRAVLDSVLAPAGAR